jgi:hypothetical protein
MNNALDELSTLFSNRIIDHIGGLLELKEYDSMSRNTMLLVVEMIGEYYGRRAIVCAKKEKT